MIAAMQPIYLDNAATTPLLPEVLEAMRPALEQHFGNPSSRHPPGVRARELVDQARRSVARALDAPEARVVFTSGGTEANDLAVLGLARASGRRHVLVGATEHPCVRQAAAQLAREGFEVETLRLDAGGALDLDDLAERLRPDTALCAVMLANNELGSVYPLRHVARLVHARSPGARVHTDAVQALGKLDLSMRELGVDSLAISAHKVHGPKGSGALLLAEDAPLQPLLPGGGQEGGLRSGTENVAGIVGLGRAAELAERAVAAFRERAAACRAALERGLAEIPGARLLEPGASSEPVLPMIAAALLPGAPAEVWMHHLEARGIYASAGSACQAGKNEVSPALLAAGLRPDEARSVLRFSTSRETAVADVERAVEALLEVAQTLESVAP